MVFFHAGYLSPLLMEGGQPAEELQDLVVLKHRWLISVMNVIMELKSTSTVPGLHREQIIKVVKTGVADLDVLAVFWKDFLPAPADIQIRHLCLILEAYWLICPLPPTPSGSDQVTEYIIPCKLPDKTRETCPFESDAVTFYFNFCQFLPAEVYHRLICLALRDSEPIQGPAHNLYSSKRCVFYNLYDTNWIMELDMEKHRLKISVV